MQTLVFNTATKTAKLYSNKAEDSELLYEFINVPTIKVVETYYEVMQLFGTSTEEIRVPVARFPVANTNMIIKK